MSQALSFFADENISPVLIHWIRECGYKISGVKEELIEGFSDLEIIEKGFISKSIILTHDNDFGKIIFTQSISFSIIYLRPLQWRVSYTHIKEYFEAPAFNSFRDSYNWSAHSG